MRRAVVLPLFLVLALAIGAAGGFFASNAFAAGKPVAAATTPPETQAVVNNYLSILDTGMASSACDFSGLAAVYAPDARVTASGGPFAPGGPFGAGNAYSAQEFDGLQAITGFYTKLCMVLHHAGLAAPSWSQDAGFLLNPTVLNSYEHVSNGGHTLGRCMHAFTVRGNQIVSLDWAVYQ